MLVTKYIDNVSIKLRKEPKSEKFVLDTHIFFI